MRFPYKVTVTGKGEDVHVKVEPQPITTKEEFNTVVTGAFQKALMSESIANTAKGRAQLKHDIEHLLKDFHNQRMIVPRDEKR